MSDLCPYELEDNIWNDFEESDDHIVPHSSRENMNQVSALNDGWKKSKSGVIDLAKELDIANKCNDKQKLNTQAFLGKGTALENGPSSKKVKTMTSSGTGMANHCLKSNGVDTEDGEFCISDSIVVGRSNAVDCDLYNYRFEHISQGDRDLNFPQNDHEDMESNELLYYGWQDIGNFDDVDRVFRCCDSTFGLGNLVNEEESCWFGFSCASDESADVSKPSFKFTCSEGSALEGLAPNNKNFNQMKACSFDGKSFSVEEKMDAEEHTSLERIEVLSHFKPKSALKDETVNEDQVISFDTRQVKIVESPHKPSSEGPGKCFNGNKKTMLHHNVPVAVSRNFEQTSSVAFNKRVEQVLPSEIEMEGHSEVEGIELGMAGEIDSMNLEESFSMSSLLNEISLEATSFQQLQRVIEQLDVRTKLSIRDGLYRLARSAEQRHSYIDPKDKIGDNKDASGILMVQDTKRCLGLPHIEMDTNPIDRSIAHLLFHRPLDSSVMCKDDSCLRRLDLGQLQHSSGSTEKQKRKSLVLRV